MCKLFSESESKIKFIIFIMVLVNAYVETTNFLNDNSLDTKVFLQIYNGYDVVPSNFNERLNFNWQCTATWKPVLLKILSSYVFVIFEGKVLNVMQDQYSLLIRFANSSISSRVSFLLAMVRSKMGSAGISFRSSAISIGNCPLSCAAKS